jgi:type II secretion system protein D
LGKPNALLLIGRADSIEAVVALIQQLDRPVPPATQLRVFQLKHLSAIVAEDTIRRFYEERGGLGPQIRVLSDFRSNAVIVQAAPRDVAEIAALIQKIDVVRAKSVNEVRVFRLANSLAEDLALVLQQAIQGDEAGRGGLGGGLAGALTGQGAAAQAQPRAPGQGQQPLQGRSAILTLKTLDPAGQQILRSGILADVRVTADVRANALVVTGPPDNMELIGELIRQLDQLPSAEAQLKVFTIVNADAVSLVQVLEDLFGQQGGAGQAGQQLGLEESIIPLRFSVDQRTNSIIVSGAGSDLEVVEAILLRLDESDIDERKNTVYRLNNAPAADVANAINEFLRSQREVQQIAPEGTSPFEQIEREVIVVPEPVNNSLIISATPRYYEEIMRLVQDLDKRPPMVMIQVMIAEVRLNDVDEMGFELGVQDSLLFDRSAVVTAINNVTDNLDPGFLFNNQPLGNSAEAASVATRDHFAPQVLSSFGVSRTNNDLGYGGLVISGGNDEVSILIRALQDDRRVDILSRPQVMTLDNQPAFIQVGQRVPRITSSQVVEGAVINSTTLENVGIILGVTPRISPDGLVVMEIDAEKSRLGAEEDGIPISISANGQVIRSPIIDTIVAQTTVSAVSGQTVILGGLITKDDQLIARRVPYLSEIPIIGSIFRFDSASHIRSELLFIMTPYVVRDEGDVEMIKQMESQRMSWCLSDVVSIHGDVNLSSNGNSHVACWDDGPTTVIYPDLLPTAPEPLEIAPPQPLPAPQFGLPPTSAPAPVLTPTPTPTPTPALTPGNVNSIKLRPTPLDVPLDAPPPNQAARYTTAPLVAAPADAHPWQMVVPASYQSPIPQVYQSGAWQRVNAQQR